MHIRKSVKDDIQSIVELEKAAFGQDKGTVIGQLVVDLLDDPTALPFLSLVACDDEHVCGHILFTHVRIEPEADSVKASILAPLAICPKYQSKGIGGALIEEGKRVLREQGVEVVFVLGHPGYYPKYGFEPSGVHGLDAPYPIPEEHADAWMVQELQANVLARITGTVRCAVVLEQPEHWRE